MIQDIKNAAMVYINDPYIKETEYDLQKMYETINIYKFINQYRYLRNKPLKTNETNLLLLLADDVWTHLLEYLVYKPKLLELCDVYDKPRSNYNRRWFCSQIIGQNDDFLYKVHFLGWDNKWNEIVDIRSGCIQPLFTFTRNWRSKLQVGNYIDFAPPIIYNGKRWFVGLILYRIGNNLTILIKTRNQHMLISNRYVLLRRGKYYIYKFENININSENISEKGIHTGKYVNFSILNVEDLMEL